MAGRPMVYELPAELQGDPDQPTRIHWSAPSLELRREHQCMRGAALAGKGREWAHYQTAVIRDLVQAVENYEDDEGQPITTVAELVAGGEPDVISAFVEHVHRASTIEEDQKKGSSRPSGSSTTGPARGTPGTTPPAQASSPGPSANGAPARLAPEAAEATA